MMCNRFFLYNYGCSSDAWINVLILTVDNQHDAISKVRSDEEYTLIIACDSIADRTIYH